MILIYVTLCIVARVLSQQITSFDNTHYALIVDAGSTGSRAYIYRFYHEPEHNEKQVLDIRGTKIQPGLSSFADEPAAAIDYILPIFENAVDIIPPEFHSKTKVYIKGTAGMRLIGDEEKENTLWSTLYEGLKSNERFKFNLDRENLGTIDGDSEAYYAVLAANYIVESIDANLVPIPGKTMVGALDMGGASTQVIFYNGLDPTLVLSQTDFWSHSYLGYGASRIIDETKEIIIKRHRDNDHDGTMDNPCSFVGFDEEINGYKLMGTGDPDECVEIIKHVLWPNSKDEENCMKGKKCYIGGVTHPELNGHFYAMSLYFYTLDCVRQFVPDLLPHWPSPSLKELSFAVHEFCSLSWMSLEEKKNQHKYTSEDRLHTRCIEALYIVTLLEYGFGFPRNTTSITYALKVEGVEVEWTFGFALSEVVFPFIEDSTVATAVEVTGESNEAVDSPVESSTKTHKTSFEAVDLNSADDNDLSSETDKKQVSKINMNFFAQFFEILFFPIRFLLSLFGGKPKNRTIRATTATMIV